MDKIFINHTNHPSANWSEEQKAAAKSYGKVVDIEFPAIPPSADSDEVSKIVLENLQKILSFSPTAVLCQGEFTYSYKMIEQLKQQNILVMAACSERLVSESVQADGTTKRISVFNFVRFREY